jgi:hypothetical protein
MSDIVSIAPRIVVRRDIFGTRCYVEVHPRRIDRPTEFFRDYISALCYAEEMSARYGWLVVDETGGRDASPTA